MNPSKNIESIADDIENEAKFKRNTEIKINYNFTKKREEPEYLDVLKFVGVEYLPDGFLELEPILYKDEYKFKNEDD